MSGLIRTVQRDAINEAEELEREAAAHDETARQKRHTAAVLRSMTAVAATWKSPAHVGAGVILAIHTRRGEPSPSQPNGASAPDDRPPLILNAQSGEMAIDTPSGRTPIKRQQLGYRGSSLGGRSAPPLNGSELAGHGRLDNTSVV